MAQQDDEWTRAHRAYREHGMVPASERVWRHGVDVTHEPPSTWPWPYSMYVSGARGERMRDDYLRWHAEALAQRADLL